MVEWHCITGWSQLICETRPDGCTAGKNPMAKLNSAGVLLYRLQSGVPEVFLVHPGGPFWASKDRGAWSIPKGEYEQGADPLQTAKREFLEETGSPIDGNFSFLSALKQRSGKTVHAWAVEGDIDAAVITSNVF